LKRYHGFKGAVNKEVCQAVEKHSSPLEFILSYSKGGDGVCMLPSSFPSASSPFDELRVTRVVMVSLSNHERF